ncbi:MAG: lysophospholipase [Oscillospiraceae bacterium]|jgi:hypothetical protein|nr:lysophospholipase [Oscillospiraceae bacterium]
MKKTNIRAAACILAGLLLLCLASPALAAAVPASDPTPVIFLPGYSGTQLFLDANTPEELQIWPPSINGRDMRSIFDVVISILPELLKKANGNLDKAVENFGSVMFLLEKISMNEDGTSKYNVGPKLQTAHESRWDVMVQNGLEKLNNQRPTTNTFLEYVSADHIYIFSNDWRMGQADGMARLHQFIQEVKKDSGHDKVSLFGYSYGGQLAASYLTFYGGADIDRVVLHSPAVRGSRLVTDLLEREGFTFDPVRVLSLIEIFMQLELSLDQRLAGVTLEQVNELAVRIVRQYLEPLLLKFGSAWDLIPMDDYERLKALLLDPAKNARIITNCDKIHYEMMPKIGETLRTAQQQGVKIALIVGTGIPLASGNPVESDFIIGVESTAGAAYIPIDEKRGFQKPTGGTCSDPSHRHLSPDGHVDASCAYLPENTWFFNQQYHGQACWDPYAKELYNKFLFTDEIQDIYSDPEFPQFRDSSNPSDGLEARFSGSVSGYLTAADDTLLVTNLSGYEINLLSVTADGLDLVVPMESRIPIAPGQTARLRYETILPAAQRSFSLTLEYIRQSPVPAKGTRTLPFRALPAHETAPHFLRFPASRLQPPSLAPLKFRPVRSLAITLALAASLALAALSVSAMRRGKPEPGGRKRPIAAKAKPVGAA